SGARARQTIKGRLVLGIELRRLGIGFRRTGLVAAMLVDQRLIGLTLGNRAVQLDRVVEIVKGVVVIA
ncbi:hypothetical protein, partial [Klebsiella pneumoniae]|uniref:hypothetical protein n=1 Tax=Klebsiella pneumoniae TaxID=573 RepID=UPI001954FAA2